MKAAANGHESEGPLHKAFSVLERGLVFLSDTKTESRLSQTFCDVMNEIVQLRKRTRTETRSKAEIAEQIILPLIDGFIILNANHDDITVRSDSSLYHSVIKGWKGLGLGKRFIILLTEWFSVQCRKTKTKVITLANHKEHRQYSEPIKTRSNYR